MDTGKLVTVGAIGVGGYLLYRYMTQTTTAAAGSSSTTASFSLADLVNAIRQSVSGSPAAPASPSTDGTGAADSAAVQTAKIIAAAGGDASTLHTASEWSWFYTHVYGDSGVDVLLGDDGSPMTAGTYIGLRVQKGFSGVGMGAVQVVRPVVIIRGAEGRPVMVLGGGKRVVLGGGW